MAISSPRSSWPSASVSYSSKKKVSRSSSPQWRRDVSDTSSSRAGARIRPWRSIAPKIAPAAASPHAGFTSQTHATNAPKVTPPPPPPPPLLLGPAARRRRRPSRDRRGWREAARAQRARGARPRRPPPPRPPPPPPRASPSLAHSSSLASALAAASSSAGRSTAAAARGKQEGRVGRRRRLRRPEEARYAAEPSAAPPDPSAFELRLGRLQQRKSDADIGVGRRRLEGDAARARRLGRLEGAAAEHQIPRAEEARQRQHVDPQVEKPLGQDERHRLADALERVGGEAEARQPPLEEVEERVDLDGEAAERRLLGVEVGRQPAEQRGEEAEGRVLVVLDDAEHRRRDEVHRLAVADLGPQHAPRAQDASKRFAVGFFAGLRHRQHRHARAVQVDLDLPRVLCAQSEVALGCRAERRVARRRLRRRGRHLEPPLAVADERVGLHRVRKSFAASPSSARDASRAKYHEKLPNKFARRPHRGAGASVA